MCDYHIKEGFLPLTMWSHEDGIIVQLSYAINGVEQVRYHSLLSLDNGELPDCTFQQAIDFILNKGE